jgi:hypothetical protein
MRGSAFQPASEDQHTPTIIANNASLQNAAGAEQPTIELPAERFSFARSVTDNRPPGSFQNWRYLVNRDDGGARRARGFTEVDLAIPRDPDLRRATGSSSMKRLRWVFLAVVFVAALGLLATALLLANARGFSARVLPLRSVR